jgi:parallel beta-helix repeat protein
MVTQLIPPLIPDLLFYVVQYERFVEGPKRNEINLTVAGLFHIAFNGTINENGVTQSSSAYTKVSLLNTPYGSYTNLFQIEGNIASINRGGKYIFDSTGRIISFNTVSDTLKFFYLVE